jgi:hypothetical protein
MRSSKPSVGPSLQEILQSQMDGGDPPEVKATYSRLVREGLTAEYAWSLLSGVLLLELNAIVRDKRKFDRARYVAHLRALPTLPGDLRDEA